jgi:hypothetical protein
MFINRFKKPFKKMVILISIIGSPFLLAGEEGETYSEINLDQFIEEQTSAVGKTLIVVPFNLKAEAVLKSYPEERTVEYLYTALQLMKVDPLPEVNHRMFIESEKGKIIPVYVDDHAAPFIKKGLQLDKKATFLGYHVYNYSKGPAIVIEAFE